jgi:hypothetical protein
MANVIKIKNSGTANSAPTSLEVGELAINYNDGKIFYKDTSNAVVEFTGPSGLIISNTAPAVTDILWADTSVTGVGVVPVGGTTGQMLAKSSSADYDAAWATPVTSSDLALKAPLASPALTGTPTSPTAAVGTNTTQLATTEFVTTAASNVTSGFRNVVINGDMKVAQRGTSASLITTSGYYTADRMSFIPNTMGQWTQSVVSNVPAGSGFYNNLTLQCTTADASPSSGDYVFLQQKFEGQDVQRFAKGTASAKPFALSFWVKSNLTGTYIAELIDTDNTRQVSASYTINASSTWEKKIIIFPADTTGVFDRDNDVSLRLNFVLGAGSTYTSGTLNTAWASTTNANRYVGQTNLASAESNSWSITGIQLEEGSVATPFEQRPIGVELDLCFRYYQKMVDPAGVGVANASSQATRVLMPLYTKMRAAPTSTISGTVNFWNGGSTGTATSLLGTYNSVSQGQLDFAGGVGSAGQAVTLYTTGGSQFIDFSAEL